MGALFKSRRNSTSSSVQLRVGAERGPATDRAIRSDVVGAFGVDVYAVLTATPTTAGTADGDRVAFLAAANLTTARVATAAPRGARPRLVSAASGASRKL